MCVCCVLGNITVYHWLSGTPQSSAQTILISLNNFFKINEEAVARMLKLMDDMDIPEEWECVDLVKQTEALMVSGACVMRGSGWGPCAVGRWVGPVCCGEVGVACVLWCGEVGAVGMCVNITQCVTNALVRHNVFQLAKFFVFQSSTARMTLTEELLFVRKMQAIIDFCSECKSLLKAFRLDLSITDSKPRVLMVCCK